MSRGKPLDEFPSRLYTDFMIRVSINGYGRIGRIAHRVILEKYQGEIDIAGINVSSSTDIKGWFYLLKYDTVYGPLNQNIKYQISNIKYQNQIGSFVIGDKEILVFSQKDPSLLPWKDLNIDVVIESTGSFRNEEALKAHLKAGAKKIVLSAPAKDENISTYILSVNDREYKGESLVGCASCTTNCIAPVAKIMLDNFGVEKAMMTTIHGYTSDQRLQDGGHKDYRRGRAGALNIVPTTTGAAKTTEKVLPQLSGIFNGLAIRAPVPVGSLSDFTFLLKKNVTKEEVNDVFEKEAKNPLYNGILEVTKDPLVSSDIIGNPNSAIIDLSLTQVVDGNLVKVIAWYDNEYAYANRLVEEVIMVANSK